MAGRLLTRPAAPPLTPTGRGPALGPALGPGPRGTDT
jgi:hypothetical protein